MRRMKVPAAACRASIQLWSAVRILPTCNRPVGEGAKRVVVMPRAVERPALPRKLLECADLCRRQRQRSLPQPMRPIGTDQPVKRGLEPAPVARCRRIDYGAD